MPRTAHATRQFEPRIRELGAQIFKRARAAEPSIIRPDWWMTRLMNWATSAPKRKLQLFRFVDVLPTLQTDESLVRHLAEYLLQDDVPLPGAFGRMLKHAADGAWYQSQLASAARYNAQRMARKFIAGQTPDEAIELLRSPRDQRMAFTIDILGEATNSDVQADWYQRQCLSLLDALGPTAKTWNAVPQIDDAATGPMPRVNLSIKLSSLDPNFDPIAPEHTFERVGERLRPILRKAMTLGCFVNIDMEQHAYRDLTLDIFKRVLMEPEFAKFADVGIVIQAYLQDAPRDLDGVLTWVKDRGTPIAVRIVKGAYWAYDTVRALQRGWSLPVLTKKWQSDAQFEQMCRTLLDHTALIRPAIASHNVRSIAAALAYAEANEISPQSFELQMLFGMGDPLKTAVAEMDYTLRVYTPFGELIPGMAYLIRRLLENTSNESFLKHTFSEQQSTEQLLADPAEAKPASMPLPQPHHSDPDEDEPMSAFESEPLTDFSRTDARQAMQAQIDALPKAFGRDYPLLIAGKHVTTDATLDSVNPSQTNQVVGRVCLAQREHVELAVNAATKAFAEWRYTTAEHRANLLRKAAELMRTRRFELAAWIVYEVGKPWREADGDVAEAIDFCNFYAAEIERLDARPRQRDYPGQENAYIYQPRGVVAVIAPWNFPLAILTGMATAALAAGNTVVMKPAEQSSVIGATFANVLNDAGFPAGVVNFLPGDGEVVGAALVEHPDVSVIAFTGSRQVGVHIYETAAKLLTGQTSLKRVIAEMGGKNAIIIDDDADLDEAAEGVLASAFGYAGQKCSACSRAIVLKSVKSAFVEKLVDAARSIRIGPATTPDTLVGPLVDEDSRSKTMSYIERGKAESKLVFQADLAGLETQGTFAPPTIFADVPPDASIAQEEIFGPVVAVIDADDFEHAITIANSTDYALTGGVYSRSPANIDLARQRFNVGNLYINQKITGALVDRQPFGGFKMSGVGSKAGGPDYLKQFMDPKSITENTLRHGFAPEADQSK